MKEPAAVQQKVVLFYGCVCDGGWCCCLDVWVFVMVDEGRCCCFMGVFVMVDEGQCCFMGVFVMVDEKSTTNKYPLCFYFVRIHYWV